MQLVTTCAHSHADGGVHSDGHDRACHTHHHQTVPCYTLSEGEGKWPLHSNVLHIDKAAELDPQ